MRERELIFEPRGAWQILLKSALPAFGGRAEALCAEATNAEHTIWLSGWDDFQTFRWLYEIDNLDCVLEESRYLLEI